MAGRAGGINGLADARQAALEQRVYSTEQSITALGAQISALSTKVETAFGSLSAKFDERGRTQWPVIIGFGTLMMIVAGAVGTLAYMPIREKQMDFTARVEKIEDRIVARPEHVERWRQFELADSRRKEEIDALRGVMMPRGEILEARASNTANLAHLQRQIDEIRRDIGGVITTRDVLQQYARKLEQLESELRAVMMRPRPALSPPS